MTISFEISFEESVESCVRVWKREQPFRSQLFAYFFRAVLFAAIASLPVFVFSLNDLLFGALTFVFVISVHLWLYPISTEKHYRTFALQACRKRFGNNNSIQMEIELMETGLRCRAFGDDVVVAWRNILEIEQTENSIYFYCNNGSTALIPRRALASGEQTARFLSSANFYWESSQQLLNA